MNKALKDRLINRIQQLLDQANEMRRAKHEGNAFLDTAAFLQWKISSLNLIESTVGQSSLYYKHFDNDIGGNRLVNLEAGTGILKALNDDLEQGFLEKVEDLVRAEVFTDFLEMAEHLLKKGYKDPAASLTGAVLEDGLRKVAMKNEVQVKGNDDISSLNNKLADAEIYNRLKRQQISTWKEIRNNAAHGKFDEYKADDVKGMIKGVCDFLAEKL